MTKSKIAAALCAAVLSTSVARANTYVWTGAAGNGNWFTPTNWSPNGTPGAGDSATLANGTAATINSPLTDTAGTILATGTGSTIDINSSGTITGGTLNTASSGVIVSNGGALIGLTNAGTLNFSGYTGNSGGLYLQGQINNTGVIQSNPAGGLNSLNAAATTATLTGGGQVLLNSGSSYINFGTSYTLTNQDNLIHGYGTIDAGLVNNGTISADSNTNTLTINAPLPNSGTVQAISGGILSIDNSATITGGTLTNATGGIMLGDGGTIVNLTNAGTLNFSGYPGNYGTGIGGINLQGQINNTGIIQSNPAGGFNSLNAASSTATLTGGGQVLLNSGSSHINYGSAFTLTNQNNLIHGYGTIDGGLVNNATISADSSGNTLTINAPLTNSGTVQAISGGTLSLNTSAIVTGGTLTNASGGVMLGDGGLIVNLTNAGTLNFSGYPGSYGTGIGGINLQGQINNTGIIQSNPSGGFNSLNVATPNATLTGGGQVLLNSGSSHINYGGAYTLTNQDNLIHGYGTIDGGLVNNAIVSADSSTNTLFVSGATTNNGTYKAQNGGVLSIGASLANTNANILADGANSVVRFTAGTVTGGTLSTTNGGVTDGNGGTVNAINNAGTLNFSGYPGNNGGLYLQGQINNSGTIQGNPAGGLNILNAAATTATLIGGGKVLLNSNSSYINYGSTIYTLTNQDNLIHGYGTIDAGLVNNATISADSNGNTLTINAPLANNGTVQAISGGTLSMNSNAVVTGGTLTNASGGIMLGNGGLIVNLTNAGTLNFSGYPGNYGTGIGGVNLQGQINNTGIIESNPSGGFNTLNAAASTATLTGGGQVLLNSGSSHINYGSTFILTNQNNLIHGYGTIDAGLVNNGTISADSNGNTLTINAPLPNSGTVQAISGGILSMNTNAIVTGGTLTNASGGVMLGDGGLIVNLTNAGTLNFSGYSGNYGAGIGGINLQGQINNTGIIQSNPAGGFNSLNVATPSATLTGGGQVLLNSGSSHINYGGTFTLTNQDNLIHGYGTIDGGLVNNGTVSADSSGNTLYLNSAISGTGNISVTAGATLVLSANSGGSSQDALSIASTGQLDLSNNHLFINYGSGADPIASIAAWIKSGYAGGSWNGPGIMSSSARSNFGSYGIGYADAADPGNPAGLSSGTIEIKYTLLGDANLDGAVNGSDFAILATNFNKAVSAWDQGDFNYDGAANGADFAFLAANFNKGASQSADTSALDSFALANGLLADVPEPASAGLILLAATDILARRRRGGNA